jgi:type II secretory pathway predicted ATPase ExeA
MYETFFRLRKRPFSATPDPSCFFLSPGMVEGLTQLRRSVEAGQGIGLIVSPSGLGKTLLLRKLAEDLLPRFTVVFLSAAGTTTRRALLQSLLYELGERYSGLDEDECRLELKTSLRRLSRSQRGAVLIVDEADQLDSIQLGELRTWVDVGEAGEPYLRLVLAGLPALEDRLVQPELSAFNERISTLVYPRSLNSGESRAYIQHRLAWAGADETPLFTDDALDRVVGICDGLPRCLNQLCDHALLLAYVAESPVVGRKQVDEALGDLKQLPLHWNPGVVEDADALLAPAATTSSIAEAHSPTVDEHWSAEPRVEAITQAETFNETGTTANVTPFDTVFHSPANVESFEVGAEEPISSSFEESDSFEKSGGEMTAVEFRTNVTAADLAPACEIDSETESRLRELVFSHASEDAAPLTYESTADSRRLPVGEDWALTPSEPVDDREPTTSAIASDEHTPVPATENTIAQSTENDDHVLDIESTAASESFEPEPFESEHVEIEVVRDPWPESTGEYSFAATSGMDLAAPSDHDVVAEVAESRHSGYVLNPVTDSEFAGDAESTSAPGSIDDEVTGPSDVLPFLAASRHDEASAPITHEESAFERRPQPEFEIEPVRDRYAFLDDGRTDLPPVEPTTGREVASLMDPVLSALRRDRDPRPDRAVDEILSLVEEARSLDSASPPSNGASTSSPRTGTTVVDGWGEIETGFDDNDASGDLASEADPYDVIEPDAEQAVHSSEQTRHDGNHAAPQRPALRDLAATDPEAFVSTPSTVSSASTALPAATTSPEDEPDHTWRDPTPSRYKQLFSLLRRKQRRAG